MHGTIFDIKHFAIHDGPGIRQTIFFKGCPLSCWWCHNPESRNKDVISIKEDISIDNQTICITNVVGRSYTINELMIEIEKDRVFFEESGGGVTLSGGEPLMQYEFAYNLLYECKNREINTCVDTTGYAKPEVIKKIADVTNLILFDLKHIDNVKHLKYTGVSNRIIIENLKILDSMGSNLWIRFPLMPGLNDDESDLLRLMALLKSLNNNYPVSILPYHKIGSHKYDKFGIEHKIKSLSEPDADYINEISNKFTSAGFEVLT